LPKREIERKLKGGLEMARLRASLRDGEIIGTTIAGDRRDDLAGPPGGLI
jgi:hypothetical protein